MVEHDIWTEDQMLLLMRKSEKQSTRSARSKHQGQIVCMFIRNTGI